MTWKSFTLNDLKNQYCNRNCIGCSVSSQAECFYCEKCLQNLRPIFSLFISSVAVYITCRNDHVHGTVAIYIARQNDHVWWLLYYHSMLYLSRQHFVKACMELSHLWQIAFSLWLEFGCWALNVGSTVSFPSDSWASCYWNKKREKGANINETELKTCPSLNKPIGCNSK